jgi:hypothetical protein
MPFAAIKRWIGRQESGGIEPLSGSTRGAARFTKSDESKHKLLVLEVKPNGHGPREG